MPVVSGEPPGIKLDAVSSSVMLTPLTVELSPTAANGTMAAGELMVLGFGILNCFIVPKLMLVGVTLSFAEAVKFPVTVAAALGMWKLVLAEVVESNDPPVEGPVGELESGIGGCGHGYDCTSGVVAA